MRPLPRSRPLMRSAATVSAAPVSIATVSIATVSIVVGLVASAWAVAGRDSAGADDGVPAAVIERDPSVSADGRRVVYVAPSTDDRTDVPLDSVWLLDRSDGTRTELTTRSEGIRPGRSRHPVLSDDGCSVVVVTELALDLFRDDDHGDRWDVYRTVLPSCPGGFELGAWELVSSTGDDEPSASDMVDPTDRPAVDGTGNLVVFTSRPGTPDDPSVPAWTQLQVADLTVPLGSPGRVVPVPGMPTDGPWRAGSFVGRREPSVSGDGRFVTFTTDIDVTVTENATDAVFAGTWTDAVVDGVAVTQVARWDRIPSDDDGGALYRIVSASPDGSPGDASSSQGVVDADGDVVAFRSFATDLLAPAADGTGVSLPVGTSQIYRAAFGAEPSMTLVSASPAGAANGSAAAPSIDAVGRLVAFESFATNLVEPQPPVSGDGTGADLLLADTASGAVRRITTDVTGVAQPLGARSPRLSATGRTIVFQTVAAELPADSVTTDGQRTIVQPSAAEVPSAADPTTPADPTVVADPAGGPEVPWHVAIAVAPVELSISDLDLGTAAVGMSTGTWFTTIVNNGAGAFVPASITTTAPEFPITGGTCRRTVPVLTGESCTVEVSFTPSVEGPASAELVVAERGFGAAEVRATLRAVGGVPNVVGTPSAVAFGPGIVMLPTETQSVTFANDGIAETGLASLEFAGTHPDDFVAVTDDCTGRLLSVGETCLVRVGFTPLGGGPRSATITATSTSGATAGVVLVGSGSYTPIAAIEQPSVATPSRVDIVGLGFPVHAYVTIGWAGDERTTIALTDERGELRARLDAPRSLGGGRRAVVVLDPAGQFDAVRTPDVLVGASPTSGGSSPAHRAG